MTSFIKQMVISTMMAIVWLLIAEGISTWLWF